MNVTHCIIFVFMYIYVYLYVIYTNRRAGLYKIYKPKVKLSVYTSNINRTPQFVLYILLLK